MTSVFTTGPERSRPWRVWRVLEGAASSEPTSRTSAAPAPSAAPRVVIGPGSVCVAEKIGNSVRSSSAIGSPMRTPPSAATAMGDAELPGWPRRFFTAWAANAINPAQNTAATA